MKILIAPLNWGLGHASRCVPIIRRLIDEGNEVVLGGDGNSLTLLRQHFPKLRYVYLAPLQLRYGRGKSQVWAIVRALPRIIGWSIKDHFLLKAVLREEPFDRVISDNRFGLYSPETECIYITHQLHIRMPRGWRWAEGIAQRWHARIWRKYDQVWVPDYTDETESFSGWLGHGVIDKRITYIGPQSRFSGIDVIPKDKPDYSVVCVLSGLEPHRTQLEQQLIERYAGSEEKVLIVQGLLNRPNTRIRRGNITVVPYMHDNDLAQALQNAEHIIARSGYSTIMDLAAMDRLAKAELIPTPGQPEQEYLAERLLR